MSTTFDRAASSPAGMSAVKTCRLTRGGWDDEPAAARGLRPPMARTPPDDSTGRPDVIRALIDNGMLADAIEAAGFGVVLVAEDGWIIFANTIARELIRRGIALQSTAGRLEATTAEATARLRALIKSDSGQSNRGGTAASTLALARRADRQPLLAHVTAFGGHNGRPPRGPRTAAAIVISDPERYAALRLEAFSSLYGLTAAETRVLQEIVGGQGLVKAAATLGISPTTARTHMQRIFGKTATKRQTELLCLFFGAVPSGRQSAQVGG